ncbi:MAG TPA: ATP-binding cassette domain-containing protein [Pseudonocardiaceae bacterium]|jgi:ABC-type multidrug transport system ATPase subunit
MADMAIVVDNITKRFGKVHAVNGVSFEAERGQVFALLGPNGAGKSTTVRIMTTNETADSGRVEVLGLDIAKHSSDVRALIGLAGQAATIDGALTSRENLRLIGRLTHVPRHQLAGRVDELLDRFGLSHVADRPARTYSGGLRRRLDIAAALLHRPPVLFLDEPTTGLDLESRLALWELVQELVTEGTTVLLTTQYLEEADRLAHQVTVIGDGKVLANGTPAELKAKVGSAVVELGFGTEEIAVKAITALERLRGAVPQREGDVVLIPSDDGARATMDAMTILDGQGLRPTTMALRQPSLDDAFLSLTSNVSNTPSGITATGVSS